MGEPARIRFEEGAQIRNVIFQHGKALDTDTEGKTLPLVRVEITVAQHIWMHHAAAENFQPIFARADYQTVFATCAANIHLCGWFCEGEEARAEAHRHIFNLKKCLKELFKNPFQVTEVNIFINIGLNLFFIIYCPYALENNLPTAGFVRSIYDPLVGVGYVFIANLFASIVTFLMLLPEMIKTSWAFIRTFI